MKECIKCNFKNVDTNNFCNKCGANLNQKNSDEKNSTNYKNIEIDFKVTKKQKLIVVLLLLFSIASYFTYLGLDKYYLKSYYLINNNKIIDKNGDTIFNYDDGIVINYSLIISKNNKTIIYDKDFTQLYKGELIKGVYSINDITYILDSNNKLFSIDKNILINNVLSLENLIGDRFLKYINLNGAYSFYDIRKKEVLDDKIKDIISFKDYYSFKISDDGNTSFYIIYDDSDKKILELQNKPIIYLTNGEYYIFESNIYESGNKYYVVGNSIIDSKILGTSCEELVLFDEKLSCKSYLETTEEYTYKDCGFFFCTTKTGTKKVKTYFINDLNGDRLSDNIDIIKNISPYTKEDYFINNLIYRENNIKFYGKIELLNNLENKENLEYNYIYKTDFELLNNDDDFVNVDIDKSEILESGLTIKGTFQNTDIEEIRVIYKNNGCSFPVDNYKLTKFKKGDTSFEYNALRKFEVFCDGKNEYSLQFYKDGYILTQKELNVFYNYEIIEKIEEDKEIKSDKIFYGNNGEEYKIDDLIEVKYGNKKLYITNLKYNSKLIFNEDGSIFLDIDDYFKSIDFLNLSNMLDSGNMYILELYNNQIDNIISDFKVN